MRLIYRSMSLALLCLALLPVAAFAQYENGSIVGSIHDTTGAAVPNAVVTITNADTNISTKETTNSAGEYEAPSVRVGTYTISASAAGFSDAVAKNISV